MEYPYHRLARSAPGYRWWRPLVTVAIALGFFLVLTLIVTVVFFVFIAATGGVDALLAVARTGTIDYNDPAFLALSLVSVAIMLPSILLARRITGPRPVGLLSSVRGRIRWGWLAKLLIPVLLVNALSFGLPFLIPGDGPVGVHIGSTTWATVILAIVLVPVQAAAEEYVFRGFLMQTVGGWLRHPLWAILIPVPFFAIAHQQYDLMGILDVGVFGLAATYLAWRTGGLEASILAHIVNNVAIFVLGAFSLVDSNSTTSSAADVLVSVLTLGAYIGLVELVARWSKLKRTRDVEPPSSFVVPPPPPPGALPYGWMPVQPVPAAAPEPAPPEPPSDVPPA